MANFGFKLDKKTYEYLMENVFTAFSKIDVDLINDWIETDPDSRHSDELIKAMNRREVDLASAMCSIMQLILAANELGINIGFGTDFVVSEGKLQNKIQISIDSEAVLKYGNRIFEIAAEVVDLMKKWIVLINSYGTHLYGANDAIYIRSARYNKFTDNIKVIFIK